MSKLSVDIQNLLNDAGYGSEMVYYTDEQLTRKIEAVVKEDGYKKVIDLTPETQIWGGKRLMTGQKWFSNFEKQIDGVAFPDPATISFFVNAAKKASEQ